MGARAITVPSAVPVARERKLPHRNATSGKTRPPRPVPMHSQVRPSTRPVSFISWATMPAKNQANSMVATISEAMPWIRRSAQWAGSFARASAVATAASAGTQKAAGMALPAAASKSIPDSRTAKGSSRPKVPYRNRSGAAALGSVGIKTSLKKRRCSGAKRPEASAVRLFRAGW